MEYPILTAPVHHPVVSTHQSTARSKIVKIDMGQVTYELTIFPGITIQLHHL